MSKPESKSGSKSVLKSLSNPEVPRREFLHVGAATAGAVAMAAFLESCKTRQFNTGVKTTGPGAKGAVRVRQKWQPGGKDLRGENIQNQVDYAEAVRLLKANDAIYKTRTGGFFDGTVNEELTPLSWTGLAWIHYASCPHGNWYFLPWHRLYLAYFEAACAKVLRKPDFSLPYWDWTADENRIPSDFFDTKTEANASLGGYATAYLGDGFPQEKQMRRFTAKTRLSEEFAGAQAINGMLDIDDFYQFASDPAVNQRDQGSHGQLEGLPHNNVHGSVGGFMGMMLSPLDPIFWLHHCNVDRLWEVWKTKHGEKAMAYDITHGKKEFTRKDWLEKELKIAFADAQSDASRVAAPSINLGSRETGLRPVVDGHAKVADLLETLPWGYVYDDKAVRERVDAVWSGNSADFANIGGGLPSAIAARGVSTFKAAHVARETRYPFGKDIGFLQDAGIANMDTPAELKAQFFQFLKSADTRASLVVSNVKPPPNSADSAQLVIRFFLQAGSTLPPTDADLAALRMESAVQRPDYLGSYAFFSNMTADMAVAAQTKTTHMHMRTVDIAIEMTTWAKAWGAKNSAAQLPASLRLFAVFADPDHTDDRVHVAEAWAMDLATENVKVEIVVRGT